MAPTWEKLKQHKTLARAFRGPFASAYMKAVRLGRAEDAMYWLAVMHRGKAGPRYLRRRIFGSSGEDNNDIWIHDEAEKLLLNDVDTLEPMLYAGAYLLSIGTKWYELADGQEYTQIRARAGLVPHPDPKRHHGKEVSLYKKYADAVAAKDVANAYWCLDEVFARKFRPFNLYLVAAAAGESSHDPLTRQLAAIIRRQHAWLAEAGKTHMLRQLIWAVARKPLASAVRQPNAEEYAALRAAVTRRLAREIEAVPSWAQDGIHINGSDPRFAGSWAGCLNMVEMFRRDGYLAIERPGVSLREGMRLGRSA